MTYSIMCSAIGCNLEETPENVSQSGNGSLHANDDYQDDAGHEKKYHLRNNAEDTRLNIQSIHDIYVLIAREEKETDKKTCKASSRLCAALYWLSSITIQLHTGDVPSILRRRKFENAAFFVRLGQPSTLICHQNGGFPYETLLEPVEFKHTGFAY